MAFLMARNGDRIRRRFQVDEYQEPRDDLMIHQSAERLADWEKVSVERGHPDRHFYIWLRNPDSGTVTGWPKQIPLKLWNECAALQTALDNHSNFW